MLFSPLTHLFQELSEDELNLQMELGPTEVDEEEKDEDGGQHLRLEDL